MPAMRGLLADHVTATLDPRLQPASDEPVLVKKGQSAFIGTPLAQILLGLGVDTLLVTGANTSGCVRGTVMDAGTLGYSILLVEEALGDVTRQVHDASIYDMDAKNGDLTSLADAMTYLEDVSRTRSVAARRD
jgi:nicotinamidase-related amidase